MENARQRSRVESAIEAVHENVQVPGGVFSEVECMVVTLPSRRVSSHRLTMLPGRVG